MPPEPVRVLSLVPRDSTDIRDAPGDTFGDVEARLFRANLTLVAAGLALSLGVILLIAAAARAARRYRAAAPVRTRTIPAAAIMRAASKELAAVQALSQQDGWTGALTGRAASAVQGGICRGALAADHAGAGERDMSRCARVSSCSLAGAAGWRFPRR